MEYSTIDALDDLRSLLVAYIGHPGDQDPNKIMGDLDRHWEEYTKALESAIAILEGLRLQQSLSR
jgi:hypothetical protein